MMDVLVSPLKEDAVQERHGSSESTDMGQTSLIQTEISQLEFGMILGLDFLFSSEVEIL